MVLAWARSGFPLSQYFSALELLSRRARVRPVRPVTRRSRDNDELGEATDYALFLLTGSSVITALYKSIHFKLILLTLYSGSGLLEFLSLKTLVL